MQVICYLTKIMKDRNLQLLKKIAEVKQMNIIEKDIFIEKYSKPIYYTPEIGSEIEEIIQSNKIYKKLK